MTSVEMEKKVRRMLELTELERRFVRELALEDLEAVFREKTALAAALPDHEQPVEDPGLRSLIETLREENSRNARLFSATLGWVREMLEFFGRKTAPEGYGSHAGTIQRSSGGNLLSGKV